MAEGGVTTDNSPVSGEKTTDKDILKKVSTEASWIARELEFNDQEFAALSEPAKKKMAESFEEVWKVSVHGENNSPERRLDLAVKTRRTPSSLVEDIRGVWWEGSQSNPTVYANKIKEIKRQYVIDGAFDKEGFTFAMAKKMMEVSSTESKRGQIVNTLFLMDQVVILDDPEDLGRITIAVRMFVGRWLQSCDILARSGEITHEENDRVMAVGKRMEDFAFGIVEKSIRSEKESTLNGEALGDFKKTYSRIAQN